MIKFIQIFFALCLGAFISGCAPKTYEKNQSYFILIKTPLLKYADLGYIRSTSDEVRVDLFIAGQLIQSIEIDTLVCVNEGCLTKSAFNKDYLHESYPKNLLLNVLLGRPIFEKASFELTSLGFRQVLQSSEYNIEYKVENGEIFFKDSHNKLKIKILLEKQLKKH